MMQSSAYSLAETVESVIAEHAGKVGSLLPVLHAVQKILGYIPSEAVPMIASAMSLSRAEVHGVMSYYHDFRSEPPGDNIVQICRAEACQAMGSAALEQHVKERLGVEYGETTPDGLFTLDRVYCLGNCACSPSVRINDDIHARVTPEKFDALVREREQAD